MIIIYCQSAFGQKVDSTCFKIISSRLEVIKNYLENPNSDTLLKRVGIISFLSELTGIPSESDGSYIGQTMPTKKDYQLWFNWLLLNQTNLTYDKQHKTIILNKSVQVPDK